MRLFLKFLSVTGFVLLGLSVFSQPVASFTASVTQACAPENITFTNTSTNCTGPITYYWLSGTGDDSNNENPTFHYETGGVYTVSLTITCAEGTDTETMVITIFNSPVADFDGTVLTGCVPYDANFVDLSTIGDAAISEWQWYFGDGYDSDLQNPPHTYNSTGSFNVSLIVTDLNGCISQYTHNAHVLVGNQPVVSFSADNNTWCNAPHSFQFTSDVTTSFGLNATYEWDFGDGLGSTEANPPHEYATNGVFDVTLTVTDEYGCVTVVPLEDYIRITESVAEYTVTEGDVVCLGNDVHFINQTGYSCHWDFGDGAESFQSTPIHAYSATGVVTVEFTVDPGGICEKSTTFDLTVEQVTASYTSDPAPGDLFSCTTPFEVNFTNTSSANGTSFFWLFETGQSSTEENPTHIFNTPGTWTPVLTVVTEHNCSNTFIGPQVVIHSPDASFVGDTIEGCGPLTIDFTYTGTTPTPNITNFSWDFNNGQTIPSGTNTATSTFDPGEYTVTLTITDDNGCDGVGTLDIIVGDEYIPTFDVFENDAPDFNYPPLPDHYLCAQDTVAFYLMEWDDDQYEFTWLIDSTQNMEPQEYTPYAFDQDTGWHYLNIITEWNGCIDTLLWDSVFISAPIIRSISFDTDCANPRDFVFSVDTLLASNWDWEIYNWAGDDEDFLSFEYNSTDIDYPFTFPPSPDSFWIRVTARNDTTACIFVDSLQITISSPLALFAVIDPEVCVDEQITFNGALSSGNITGYKWDYGDGNNSGDFQSEATSTYTYTQVGTFIVTLTVTDANGCENSMTDEIHVLGPEVYFEADFTFGCNNLDVIFTESIVSDDVISWVSWDFGDGGHDFGENSVSHTYDEPGVYTVTVVAHTVTGCESTLILENYITVDEVAAFFNAPDQSGCAGDEFAFNATETDPTYTYTWNFGEGANEVGNNPSVTHVYPNGGMFDIYLKVDNGLGCMDELLIEDYILIQQPVANFSLDDNDFDCWPAVPDIIPNNSVLPAGTTLYYEWIMGTGDTLIMEDPVLPYNMPGEFDIVLNLSTPLECTSTYTQHLSVDGPYADVFISNDSACVGEEIFFEITDLQNVLSFQWVVGGGDTYTVESFYHSYDGIPPLGYYPVSLEMSSGPFCNPSRDFNIYIFDPTAGITITDPDLNVIVDGKCSPYEAILTSSSVNDYMRYWFVEDDPFGTGQSSEHYTLVNNGATDQTITIGLVVEDVQGCLDTTETTIKIYALPQIVISNDTTICEGDAIAIYAADGDVVDSDYLWSPNESISAVNVQTPTVNPVENITYYVDVINAKGCSATDSVLVEVQQEFEIVLTPALDTIIIGDSVFSLLVSDTENLTYLWDPQDYLSCYNCPMPYFFPEESTRYNLTVQDSSQCFTHNYYIDIVVLEQYTLDVPGAFTPLGSEGNQIVYANGYGIRKLLQFRIYNRWGEEVFFTDDIHKGWDGYYKGQLQNIDNYSYYVEAEMFNGTIQSKKGNIMLVR